MAVSISERLGGMYPYVPGKGGIDFSSLLAPIEKAEDSIVGKEIKGASGGELILYANSLQLLVGEKEGLWKKTSKSNWLGASILGSYGEATLCFGLKSKKVIGMAEGAEYPIYSSDSRHPDLYAKKFIGVALAYFDARGIKIDSIMGRWEKGGDNYNQYRAALAGIKDPNSSQKVAAAKETWSGKTFMAYGFTDVHNWSDSWDRIDFRFQKPI